VDDVDRTIFAAAMRVTMHDGRKSKFWTSSWLNGLSPAAMFLALFKHSKRKNRSVANAMKNDNLIRDIIDNITSTLFVDYVMLWTLVDQASFNPSDQGEDDII
jgi:hypothetical protein